jgi:regulator of sirC expression with transglutaminase-like and TPR domain
MSSKIKAAFTKEVAKPNAQINLAYAALLISEYLMGATDVTFFLAMLDEMADSVHEQVQAASTELGEIQALNHFLFREMGFSGNSQNYYHPNNSFLDKVLELRTGIPIALSVIYIEVARRLGLPVWGIGMPGHFIVGYGSSNNPIYIDVFNQGQILTEDDCLALSNVSPTNRLTFRHEFLKPATPKAILYRMLLNLKHIYVNRENWELAYKTVDLMLLVRPNEVTEIRDLGLLAYRLNHLREAVFNIKRYLYLEPKSLEAGWLAKQVETMEEHLLRLN